MRTLVCGLLIALAVLPMTASSAIGQAGRAAVGGAIGVAGGAVITISVIVARARFQNVYVESADDLIHWQTTPMLLTPAVGVMFGLAGRDALVGSIIGSTSGMMLGTVLGAGIGWIVSPQAEAPWAGAVIGAGLGMTVGGLLLGIRGWIDDANETNGDSAPVRVGVRIPL